MMIEWKTWARKGTQWLWAGLGMMAGWMIVASPASAQSGSERSLRVWVDTINLNVCEGREFNNLGVWLESFVWDDEGEKTDSYIGFRQEDNVLGSFIVVRWDTSRIKLEAPYFLTPPQTLFGRFPVKRPYTDKVASGELTLEVSADEGLKTVIGKNIPLFYLKGRVTTTDTLDLPEAGARTQSLYIEGSLGDNTGTVDFVPGFVRVIRDTTPEYTGALRITEGMLDTNRRDTIFVIARNLADRRVRELRFALRADTEAFRFVEGIEGGTLAASGLWSSKQVEVQADSVYARFVADADLTTQDSLVLGIIIERTTDSSFSSTTEISDFGINVASCLGKLQSISAVVEAETIPEEEDTTTTAVWDRVSNESGTEVAVFQQDGKVRLVLHNVMAEEIILHDITGRVVAKWGRETIENDMEIEGAGEMKRGSYFLTVRDRNRRIWYKQIFIQTN